MDNAPAAKNQKHMMQFTATEEDLRQLAGLKSLHICTLTTLHSMLEEISKHLQNSLSTMSQDFISLSHKAAKQRDILDDLEKNPLLPPRDLVNMLRTECDFDKHVSNVITNMQFEDRIVQQLNSAMDVMHFMTNVMDEYQTKLIEMMRTGGIDSNIMTNEEHVSEVLKRLKLGALQDSFLRHMEEQGIHLDVSKLHFNPYASPSVSHSNDVELF